MGYFYLGLAILSEVVGTAALPFSCGFSKWLPSSLVVIGYALSFYFLSLVLQTIPMGIAYAIWSGVGIVLISIAGIVLLKQIPDLAALIGMGLIIAGVVVIHFFSKTT